MCSTSSLAQLDVTPDVDAAAAAISSEAGGGALPPRDEPRARSGEGKGMRDPAKSGGGGRRRRVGER